MKVQTIAKLWNISKKATGPTLQNIWVENGNLYATDSYILFRIKSNEFTEDDNGILKVDEILRLKNSELIALKPYLQREHDFRFPKVDKILDDVVESKDGFTRFNPEYLDRINKVFESLKFGRADLVHPVISINAPYLRFFVRK